MRPDGSDPPSATASSEAAAGSNRRAGPGRLRSWRRRLREARRARRERVEQRARDRRHAEAYALVARLRDRHAGGRGVVLASGPSLEKLDLGRLAGETVIGVNRSYRALELGLPRIDHHVIVDILCYRDHAQEIKAARVGERLYNSAILDLPEYRRQPEPALALRFRADRQMPDGRGHFSTDLVRGYYSCRHGTVVLAALQVAWYLGLRSVILLGCDFDFGGPSHHFYESSLGEAERREKMDVEAVSRSLRVCRRAFEAGGGELLDASPDSRLGVLERRSYEALFGRGSATAAE